MSRPQSRSPHYRRFPWEEPGFDPYKVLADLDGSPSDRSHRPREDPEDHWDYFREDMYPEDQRRSPSFPGDRQFGQRHNNQEEFYRRRPSPRHDEEGYAERRLSPPRDARGDGERRRGGFRQHFQGSEVRERSPPRVARERLPVTPWSRSDHQQREPGGGWRREEQGRGRGRIRDLSPSARSLDQRGRRNIQGLDVGRQREDSHLFKRQRRENDVDPFGYRDEQDSWEQRYSVDAPRGGFRDSKGSPPRGDARLGPLVIEHGHGIADSRERSPWEPDLPPDFDRKRSPSPRPASSSRERFRTLDDRDERHLQDNWKDSNFPDARRSPAPQERPHPLRYGNPMTHRGRGGPRTARGRGGRSQAGRTGPLRNQVRLQQLSQGPQDLPHEDQRPAYQPGRQDRYDEPVEGKSDWAEGRLEQWKHDRPGGLDRHQPRVDLDPKMPRQRMHAWSDQKTNNTEETLTIKVDMSRPANQNSSLCYSSDRQLSLDLVNVGRQRLDFLPMLEHSGTYQETAVHSGTFAQEIITLVHQVKEQYFRDGGLTLNERFSAPQQGGRDEEPEELTLDERFSSNRGFSFNMSSVLGDEPLFCRLGPLSPVRGPGDLRHDLERRRQERLEGVKVTISGNHVSQRPLGPGSPDVEFSHKDQLAQMDDDDVSSWPEDGRRREGNVGPRRGAASFRSNTGAQRRSNSRFGNRLGPMRRQNNHNPPAGPNW